MKRISQEVETIIKKAKLCFVATVNPDGSPNLSPKASLDVWDEYHVIFAHIESFNTVENIKINPKIAINVVDFFRRKGFCLEGKATLFQQGTPEHDFVGKPLWENHGSQYLVHCAVKVKVESVKSLKSPAYKYDEKVTEDTLATYFSNYYNNEL
ncbi:pyridoxamine 5'-phosphate oxidase family protein [Maribacter sp. PR1]|uniref:Pyridoxamine 5'-phosphate oxidase family protein n=1 Tax=Maribacter cobaltidurans TaxID=1178778 RepID=A0ABU7IY89_9FLAO|nr:MULTISPECIES: pyridoxamine 5'-phosphate oxidase family protein [Maribacter]MDC6390554.1 pyridoxamine 5'-phosphate oxidase family protein [Maribacter sp. PR1]MEE1977945.1 pyridoxamine 5'-phosphate oxidase family protein [Maribacter cobaltidurans]